MKNWMDAAGLRQFKLIGDLANAFQDTKWTKELEGQFLVSSPGNRSLNVWLKPEEHSVANSKRSLSAVLVCLMLHALLHMEQMLSHRCKDQGSLTELVLYVSRSNLGRSCDSKVAGQAAIYYLEWRFTQR